MQPIDSESMKNILIFIALTILTNINAQTVSFTNTIDNKFPPFEEETEFIFVDSTDITNKYVEFITDISLNSSNSPDSYLGLDYFYYKLKKKALKIGANGFMINMYFKQIIGEKLVIGLYCSLYRIDTKNMDSLSQKNGSGSVYLFCTDGSLKKKYKIDFNGHQIVLANGTFFKNQLEKDSEYINICWNTSSPTSEKFYAVKNKDYYFMPGYDYEKNGFGVGMVNSVSIGSVGNPIFSQGVSAPNYTAIPKIKEIEKGLGVLMKLNYKENKK
ncbi:hypothetical protein [Geofilum rhodophaeum]|uniref:hypothetical protein n=1 Tax=Geofilum rhodophaeum TaxID=1965019 RepID=UPI000B5231F6|nr:hypothetical protein [Geofilum rhodophaeum]